MVTRDEYMKVLDELKKWRRKKAQAWTAVEEAEALGDTRKISRAWARFESASEKVRQCQINWELAQRGTLRMNGKVYFQKGSSA